MPQTIDELRKKYTEVTGQARGLADKAKADGGRDLTEEESGQMNAWLDAGDQVTADIKAIQDRNTQDSRLSALEKFGDQPQAALTAPVNPNPITEAGTCTRARWPRRCPATGPRSRHPR